MKPDLDALRARYLEAQLRGDRRGAIRLVLDEGLAAGASVPELRHAVVEAAQREIGRLWQENRITIADEHMATAISNVVLAQLFEADAPAPRNGKQVVVACVEGELHDMPARLVADALDHAGFDTKFLGASVPVDGLVACVAKTAPDLVALSATMTFHVPSVVTAVARVREACGPSVRIAVGGGAALWSPDLAATTKADATARTAIELVDVARRLLGVTTEAA